MSQVLVMVGTRKGGFIFSSDAQREKWTLSGPYFKGWTVMHMTADPRNGRIHVAADHAAYGSSTHYSDDLGKTWVQSKVAPAFTIPAAAGRPIGTPEEARDADTAQAKAENVIRVWHIEPGRANEPGVLYAGVEPAALFKSTDDGVTWENNEGIYQHHTRPYWFPGAGGLCLHTIILDPNNANRMYVAISTGGCFRTDDGGLTWHPRNKNVRADFLPEKYPEWGQCVHRIAMHPSRPHVLFQQNHCGIYRSDNYGDDWMDIGDGKLPTRFGFPVVVHPHEPDTVYIVPEESDEYHMSVDGAFAVWRSRDSGNTWERLSKGLPNSAYLDVPREAMALDTCAQAGVYVGTNTGQVFYSRDAGDSWQALAEYLPPVVSVETLVV